MSYGYAEFEPYKNKTQIGIKAKKQIQRALQSIIDEMSIDWGDMNEYITQSPENLPIIFSGGNILLLRFSLFISFFEINCEHQTNNKNVIIK
jgi:hypothetical protein